MAEEVLQETYVKIWQNAERFSPEAGQPMAWLSAIARNRAIDRIRSEKIERSRVGDDEGVLERLAGTGRRRRGHAGDASHVCLPQARRGSAELRRPRLLLRIFAGGTGGEVRAAGRHDQDAAASERPAAESVSGERMSEELDNTTAEYVLGTLPADERARFSERLRNDPALRARGAPAAGAVSPARRHRQRRRCRGRRCGARSSG